MAIRIILEIWNEDGTECEAQEAFDTAEVFIDHARKFKKSDSPKILRAHIPGGFPVTADEWAQINALGPQRF